MPLAPHTTVLLASLSHDSDSAKIESLKQVAPQAWQAVIAQAKLHRLAPLLSHRLTQLDITLPSDLDAGLKQSERRTAWRNAMLYMELNKVLPTLQAQAIPAITLKGLHLAGTVYKNIAYRPILDIDLLVRKENLDQVEKAMLGLGCEPLEGNRIVGPDIYDFAYLMPQTNIRVEMHWSFIYGRYPFTIDLDGLWARAQNITAKDVPLLVLAPEDLLLHLCLHTAKHWHELRLNMLCDINEVVQHYETMDWETVAARARGWGITHAVYLVLRLARELLQTNVPQELLATLQPENFDERYLNLAREQFLITPQETQSQQVASSHLVVQLWGKKSLRYKLSIILKRFFPPRQTISFYYPVAPNSPRVYFYYLVRFKDLIARYGQETWDLSRADSQKRAMIARSDRARELHDWLMTL